MLVRLEHQKIQESASEGPPRICMHKQTFGLAVDLDVEEDLAGDLGEVRVCLCCMCL